MQEDLQLERDAEKLKLTVDAEVPELEDIGEVNAKNWKDYPDILTNSLWIIPSRAKDSIHEGSFHGNFVPQIPYQAMRRYTKPGDVVLDPFVGSGTTFIEAQKLGRNSIGVDLNEELLVDVPDRLKKTLNPHNTWLETITGDSTTQITNSRIRSILTKHSRDKVQLIMMHPPYYDILKFSEDPRDLCNCDSIDKFLNRLRLSFENTWDLLEDNHFMVMVMGDIYKNSEWVALGHKAMEQAQSVGYITKGIVVKNMEGNRAKQRTANLWRYRAMAGGYFIFKHENIFFMQKKIKKSKKKIKQ